MLLPYAVDEHDSWTHIGDVPFGGRVHDLFCPFCSAPLVAKKGAVVAHHFAHEANQTCQAWSSIADYIPPHEGYYVADLSRPQQRVLVELIDRHGDALFDASKVREPTLKSLANKRFLADVLYVPSRFQHPGFLLKDPVTRLAPRARAFAHRLTLAEYASFAESEHVRLTRIVTELDQEDDDARLALTLLQREYLRWRDTSLYLLEILADGDLFVKVGVTTRPLEQRVAEIRTFLREHFITVEVRPQQCMPRVPYVEGYIKSKFAEQRMEIGTATEYFRPSEEIFTEMDQLRALVEAGIPVPGPQPAKNPDRPRFQARYWRQHVEHNPYGIGDNFYAMLVDVVDLSTLERFAEWQYLGYGKQFEALGKLMPGDVIEFNAAIEDDQVEAAV